MEGLQGLVEAGHYPITAYPASYRFFFSFVVPSMALTTVPVQVILYRAE
jgi:ABC-2 type transport system permease protein